MITHQDDSWTSDTPRPQIEGVRVVLVGPSELERPLRRVPGMELVRAREPLGALGEVSNPIDAESPTRTIVLVAPGAVATERSESFAAGVRRIDNAARVMNIGAYALRGFDAALPDAIDELTPMDLLSRLTGVEYVPEQEPEEGTADLDPAPAATENDPSEVVSTSSPEGLHVNETPGLETAEFSEEASNSSGFAAAAAPPEIVSGATFVHSDETPSEDAAPTLGLAPETDEAESTSPPSQLYNSFEAAEGIAAASSADVSHGFITTGESDPFAPSREPARPMAKAANDAELVVQALLHGQDPIEAVMGPVRVRLGVPNAAFVPAREGEEVVAPTGGVPVRFGGRTLGHLVAPRVPREDVEAEAAQLAGWIALSTQHQQLKAAAFADELTGAWNRRYFIRFLGAALEKGRAMRRPVTLLYFDIDDFKVYNDRYGHAAGDDILVEVVKLLRSVIRPTDRVCRVGGDEFVVVFFDPDGPRDRNKEQAPDDIMPIARRFQQQICEHRFPKLAEEARGTLTVSGGMASFPWDGHDAQTLLDRADELALKSKRAGKNAITLGPGAERVCMGG